MHHNTSDIFDKPQQVCLQHFENVELQKYLLSNINDNSGNN